MKKTLGTLLTATLFLTLTVGCTEKTITTNVTAPAQEVTTTQTVPVENQISAADANRFRVTRPERVGRVEVICHNCRAHFKLSQQIYKMSMKGDAIIDCPVCHQDYLGKHK